MIEIERKFLVSHEKITLSSDEGCIIKQAYVSRDPEMTVRIRLMDSIAFDYREAWLAAKGKTDGISRTEVEVYIADYDNAERIYRMCGPPFVYKCRYNRMFGGHKWHIDRFMGKLEGLIVAEIELKKEDDQFERPHWLGDEVSYDERFFNSNITQYSPEELLLRPDRTPYRI